MARTLCPFPRPPQMPLAGVLPTTTTHIDRPATEAHTRRLRASGTYLRLFDLLPLLQRSSDAEGDEQLAPHEQTRREDRMLLAAWIMAAVEVVEPDRRADDERCGELGDELGGHVGCPSPFRWRPVACTSSTLKTPWSDGTFRLY